MMSRTLRIVGFGLLALTVFAQQKNTPDASGIEKGKISGVVVDAATGTPLAHAQVAIAPVTRRNDFRIMVAGEDGRFLFEDLDPGKYTLTAQHKGYLTQAFDQHSQYSTSIAVGPKLQSENLLFRLHRDASIAGTVIDDQNEVVRNAEIMLFEEATFNGQRNLRARTNTNDEGAYRFNHLSPGKYFVAVSSEPWYAQHPSSQPQRISKSALRSLQVTITDEEKMAKEEENVSAEQQPRSPLDVAYPTTYYPGATDPDAAAPILLSAGDRFTADLNLRAVPALRVRVALANSGPAQGGDVQVEQRLLGGFVMPVHSVSMVTEPGVIEVSGLVPGHYVLRANSYDGKNWNSSSKEVNISGDARVATDEKDAFVPLSGVVKLEPAGNFSGSGQVFFHNKQSGTRFFGQISTKGEFEVERGVPAGSYEVSVFVAGFFFKSVAVAPGRASGQIVEIGPGADVKLTLVLTQGVGNITGVALKDETPVSGAMIVLVPQDSSHNSQSFQLDQSDSDGTFTLASIVPGKYTVVAIENGWDLQWGNPTVLKPYMAQGMVVQVEAKGKYDIKVKIQQSSLESGKDSGGAGKR